MKKLLSYILFSGAVLFSGCNDYLDELPDQRTQLNSPSKVSELLVTAYPMGNYFTFTEAMSDNPIDNRSASLIQDPNNTNPYFWQEVKDISQDTPTFYWNSCYAAIAVTNQALEACNNAPNPEAYSAQRGEALVARAYAHFMLVSLFSKAYDPATAAEDPGIPYVTEPETVVLKKYERKTVAYVYEQIEKDLTEGLPLINDASYQVPAYHFNVKAAHAFATRFYLFKQQPEKVIEHANLAFPGNTIIANLRPWREYRDLSADGMRNTITRATESANLLLAETISLWSRNYRLYRFSLDQAQLAKVLAPVGTTLTIFRTNSVYNQSYYLIKFYEHFVRVNVNATSGTAYNMIPLLITEEVLFNRAEALIMQERYSEALTELNAYISTRITNYNPGLHNLTEAKIINYYQTQTEGDKKHSFTLAVLDLKRAEFLHEGMRWFDIKRHKLPVTHHVQNAPTLELLPDDLRKQIQIPEDALQAGIALNPR